MSLAGPCIKSNSLTNLRVSKVTNREERYPKAAFGLSADMKEIGRSGDVLKLRYTIAVETSPLVQRAELQGVAEVKIDPHLLSASGGRLGEDFASELALELYKTYYDVVYSLFDTLSLASPSPWLLRDVHFVT